MGSKMAMETVDIVAKEYGKGGVRILHLAKRGNLHIINEFEVSTSIELSTDKDFKVGDNSDIIATDTQKNTVYILAKQYGITTPEEFALRLANHFLTQYPWVVRSDVTVTKFPWERVRDASGKAHNHAFVATLVSKRIANVKIARGGTPVVSAGIRDLQVLKTTQSAFENFVNDEYRCLPDVKDRLLSTVVTADWTYNSTSNLDFDKSFQTIQSTILELFSGPVEMGKFSSSVQLTQHDTQKEILRKIPQVAQISIQMPNKHYFNFDFSKFPIAGIQGPGTGTVLYPVDKPSGMISSTVARGVKSKL